MKRPRYAVYARITLRLTSLQRNAYNDVLSYTIMLILITCNIDITCAITFLISLFRLLLQYYEMSYGLNVEMHKQVRGSILFRLFSKYRNRNGRKNDMPIHMYRTWSTWVCGDLLISQHLVRVGFNPKLKGRMRRKVRLPSGILAIE